MTEQTVTETTNGGELNISELREVLSESIRGVRNKTTSPAEANAITNASGKILSTVRLELEYCKITNQIPSIPLLEAQNIKDDTAKQEGDAS